MVNMAFTRACCLDTAVIQKGHKGSYFLVHSMNEALKNEGFLRGAYMFIKHRPCVFLKKAGVPPTNAPALSAGGQSRKK